MELEEKRIKEEEERRRQMIIEMEKEKLLREHGMVLNQYHPKAVTTYSSFFK